MDKYYSLKNILKENADYNIIVGKRSNGKTYSVCDLPLQDRGKKKPELTRIAYIRRYDTDILSKNIAGLFKSHDIEKMTKGKYNHVKYYARNFYLCKREEGEIIEIEEEPFCRTFSLNTWEHDKGVDNGFFDYILFDEFITRNSYLKDEFVIFCNVLSTILRDRDGSKIFLLANTVNKYCIYFGEMGIKNVDTMEQGEIRTQNYGHGNEQLKIAIEYCADSENTKKVKKYFLFDNPQLNMITSGKWEIKNYPHLTETIFPQDILQRFYIKFDHKILTCEICKGKSALICFIYQQTKPIDFEKTKNIVFDFTPNTRKNFFVNLRAGTNNRLVQVFQRLIQEQRIFFNSNETGEIFRNWKLEQAKIDNIL